MTRAADWTFLLQLDDDWRSLVFVAIFVLLPLLRRLLRWLESRVKSLGERAGERVDPREELRRRRAERRAAEDEGATLWERLERGEVLEVPRPSAPEPARTVVVPLPVEAAAPAFERVSPERPRPEGAEVPAALSVLGGVLEPVAIREESLETAPHRPLSDLFAARAGARAQADLRAPARRARITVRGTDWRRALLLAEVLAPPVSDRRPG